MFRPESHTFLKHDQSRWPSTHTGHLHQKYARYTSEQFPIGTRLFARENCRDAAPVEAAGKGKKANKSKSKLIRTSSHKWTVDTEVQIRAMVLAGSDIFVAGWRDSVGILGQSEEEGPPVLWRLSGLDGSKTEEIPIADRPVFDGMAVAYGRLYIPLQNGKVVCLEGKR